MDTPIFQAIDEWTRLESALHRAKSKNQADAENVLRSALAVKEREILESRKDAKGSADAFAVLRDLFGTPSGLWGTCRQRYPQCGKRAHVAIERGNRLAFVKSAA